jgi:hypothetical protein
VSLFVTSQLKQLPKYGLPVTVARNLTQLRANQSNCAQLEPNGAQLDQTARSSTRLHAAQPDCTQPDLIALDQVTRNPLNLRTTRKDGTGANQAHIN